MAKDQVSCSSDAEEDAVALFASMSPCQLYAELKRAYIGLITGNTRQRVRINDRDSWFNRGNMPALRAEMDRAAAACRIAEPRLAEQLGASQPRAAGYRLRPFALGHRPYKL